MPTVSIVSHGLGAALFGVLSVLLLTAWRGRLKGGLMLSAVIVSAVWCALIALETIALVEEPVLSKVAEIGRDVLWVLFLLAILPAEESQAAQRTTTLRLLRWWTFAIAIGLLVLLFAPFPREAVDGALRLWIFGFLALSVTGLVLVEQLYRNTLPEHRWAIKFLCLGVGGLFAYDFFLYSTGLLFRQMDPDIWVARGAVNGLAVPLIAVAAARNPQWNLEIFVSRHVVFHTAAVMGAGLYLLAMAGAGYYIRLYGGTWGGVGQAVFFSGAVILLFLLMFSGQLRSRAKVFLSKHFFKNRYDYREEWLRFTATLSNAEETADIKERAIGAIASIVESPGGVLWMRRRDEDAYKPVAEVNTKAPLASEEPVISSLSRFLTARGWVVFLDQYERDVDHYPGLTLPDWVAQFPSAWVIVPLMHGEELLGFITLCRSETKTNLNWEDNDLLKTVGRQAAGFLALAEATDALAESRQFEAFNRLSSYVVHDLKTLAAQLALVGTNAKKHMHNPAFIEDAFNTVENATHRMNRLLAQLRKDRLEDSSTRLVNLRPVLNKVIEARKGDLPIPILEADDSVAVVQADPDRLSAVLEHLVQNAQEATAPDGEVRLRLSASPDGVQLVVADTGCGMDADFVRQRLFKPFDTTKGNAGMGIGAYEAREFISSAGGRVEVESEPGRGTTFRIWLPAEASPMEPLYDNESAEMPG